MAIKKQSFIKGVAVIMISQVIIKLLGFLYRIILTNIKEFGDVGNSYYGSGYTVYTLILAVATLGIPNTMSKLISEKIAVGDHRGAHRIFRTALCLFASIAIMFAVGLFFGSKFIAERILSNPGVEYTLMALSPAIIFVAMTSVLRGYFVGMQNMMEFSKAQIIEQIVNSVCSILFVIMLFGASPEVMAAGSTLATTVSACTAFLYLLSYYNRNKKDIWMDIKKSNKFAIEPRKNIVKKLISYVIPISFGSVVVALSSVIDSVTVINGLQKAGLSLIEANEQFGILLGKVDILNSVPLSINVAFSVALVPFVSAAMARKSKSEAVNKINFSLKISSMIALPCTAGLFLLAPQIFELVFPNAPNGAYLLQIQCFMIIFAVLAQTLYGSLQGIGRLYVPGMCLVIGAIVKYSLNVILIPKFGIVVPAASTVIYNAIACTLSFIILYRCLKEKANIGELFIKPFLATMGMSITVFSLQKLLVNVNISNAIETIILMCTGVLSYIIFITIFKVLNNDEIQQLPYGNKICQVLRKKKKI